MNKTFKLFCVVFLLALSATALFGQQPGQRNFLLTQPVAPNDSSLWVGSVLTSGATYGYDTTTYVGTTNTKWYVRGNTASWVGALAHWWNNSTTYRANRGYNIAPWNNGPRTGDNLYVKLGQSTGAGNGFRFAGGNPAAYFTPAQAGDTIFMYFASANSSYRKRFAFDTASYLRIYTAGPENIARPNNILPVFHMLTMGPSGTSTYNAANARVLTTNPGGSLLKTAAADAGLTYDNYSADVANNFVDIAGFNQDTIMMVIDSAAANNFYPNIYFSNLRVWARDSLLQARTTGVDDTIMVAVGKGPNNIYRPSRRASLIVRQDNGAGAIYGQYQPASNMLAPAIYYNNATGAVISQNTDPITAYAGWGGAPVAKVTLLPGVPAFVRWNIGPDNDWLTDVNGEIRGVAATNIDANGRVMVGNRRQHARGRYDILYLSASSSPLQSYTARPFKVTDTATRNLFGNTLGQSISWPDTAYVFDADSNLTYENTTKSYVHMIPLDSATLGEFLSSDLRKVDSVWNAGTSTYRRALRIYNWGFKKAGSDSARIQKIRMRGYIPSVTTTVNWTNDTLNATTDLWSINTGVASHVNSQYAHGGAAYTIDSTMWFGPGKPATAVIQYRKGATGTWQSFPVTGVQYTSSEILGSSAANRSGIKITVKDLYGNAVNDGVVAFLAYPQIGAWTDTTINAQKWFGVGITIPNPHATGITSTFPTQTDTIFKYVRNRNLTNDPGNLQLHGDDYGVATIDQWMTNCRVNDYYFKFFVFDREDTLNKPIMKTGTGVEGKNLVATYGGNPNVQYAVHVVADAFASDVKLSADKSSPAYTRNTSNWHFNADTLLYSTVATGTVCDTNKATLSADLVDACERPITPTSASDVTFSVANWFRRGTQGTGYAYRTTDNRGSIDYFGKISGVNAIVGTSIRNTYNIPNIVNDTITIYVTVGGRQDSLKIATISGPPNKMLLSRPLAMDNAAWLLKTTRALYDASFRTWNHADDKTILANGLNGTAYDSLLTASRGTVYNGVISTHAPFVYGNYPKTWTFVKGYQTDCHFDTVSQATVANRKVVWRLYGPTRASMSLADPVTVFGTLATGVPNYGGNPPVSYDITTRGTRQLSLRPIANTLTGNAEYHVLLVSDSVGGESYLWTNTPQAYNLVFPKEVSTVFSSTVMNADGHTLNNTTYAWSGTSMSDTSWYTPLKPLASGALGVDATVASESFYNNATTLKNARGYNRLVVLFSNQVNDNALVADTAVSGSEYSNAGRKLVYQVIPDTNNNMKIAWLDGVGTYFNNVTATSTNVLGDEDYVLTGRQVAQIVNSELTSGTQYAFKRLVVTGNNNNTPNVTTNNNFTNYAGRIDTLFFREYDRFGNPSQRTAYGDDKLDVIVVGHTSARNTNSTHGAMVGPNFRAYTGNYGFGAPYTATKTNTYFYHPAEDLTLVSTINGAAPNNGRARFQGVIDSNGVFVPMSARIGSVEFNTIVPTTLMPGETAVTSLDSAYKSRAHKQIYTAADGKLRGAYGVAYQTIWMDGDNGTQSTNAGDTVMLALKEKYGTVNAVIPIPDTAIVISIPFDTANPSLAMTGALNQDSVLRRVDDMDTASVVLSTWGKDLLPSLAPVTSYPIIWWGHPAITKFYNPYMIRIDAAANLTLYSMNQDTIVNPNAPIYDMPDFVFNKSNMGGSLVDYLPADYYTTQPWTNRKNGIGGGYRLAPSPVLSATTTKDMRTLAFKSYRSGVTKLQVYSTADASFAVALKATATYLPYYPHWFSMSNEDPLSVHPTWESSYNNGTTFWSWPVRKDYFTGKYNSVSAKFERGKFNPVSGYLGPNVLAGVYGGTVDGPINRDSIGAYNGALTDAVYRPGPNNPRSYGSIYGQEKYPPMDTIFFGDRYVLKVRAFDRWGNRNYYVPVYFSFDVAGSDIFWGQSTFNSTAVGGNSQEAYLRQDTAAFGLNRHPYQVGDLAKYYVSDSLIVNPLSRMTQSAPTTILATLTMYYQPNQQNIVYSGGVDAPAKFTGWVDINGVFNRYAQYALGGGNSVDLKGTGVERVQVSYRQLYVKELQNPGNFALNISNAPTLVRTENGDFSLNWTRSNSTNTYWQSYGDSIRYTVYCVAKKSGGNDTISWVTGTTASGMGVGFDSSFVWTKDNMETKLSLGTSNMYNRDAKFYVIANNRWGKSTKSSNETNWITFEKNVKPTNLSLNAPANNSVLLVTGDTTYTLVWNRPTDANGIGHKDYISDPQNPANTAVTSYGRTDYILDTMFYKVALSSGRVYPGSVTLNYAKIDTIISGENLLLPKTRLWEMLGGTNGADSVEYTWTVTVIDRKDSLASTLYPTATWKFVLSKIDAMYKILVTKDISNGTLLSPVNFVEKVSVLDSATIELTAVDGSGDVIRGFCNVTDGSTTPSIKVRLAGMKAVTDATPGPSLQSRIISYTNPATGVYSATTLGADGMFTLPVKAFVDQTGKAVIKLQDRRASDTVSVMILSADNPQMFRFVNGRENGKSPLVKLNSNDTTCKYAFEVGPVAKLKTQVTPRRSGIVFLLKAMEVVITPIDKFNNEIVTLPVPKNMYLQVDPADDIYEAGQVGARFISGKTYTYLTPTRVHEVRNFNEMLVGAFLADDISGLPNYSTGAFVKTLVVHHIPIKPDTTTMKVIDVVTSSELYKIGLKKHTDNYTFKWGVAVDTNDTPLVKTPRGPNGEIFTVNDQCVVKYSVRFKEYTNAPFPMNVDTARQVNITGAQLKDVMLYIKGASTTKEIKAHWYIVFEDDTYKYTVPAYTDKLTTGTKEIVLWDDGITPVAKEVDLPTVYALDQNYPNPFNPTTTINYSLPKESNVKLTIYNILGQPVRTLVSERQAANFYSITWDGKNDKGLSVSTGTYIYRITADDFVSTKKMNLLK